jgi:hypothetical protein
MTLEELKMDISAEARILRAGRIRFNQSIWDGSDGVDFPFMLSQLGLVVLDIEEKNLVRKTVTVFFRWRGFPEVPPTDKVPEYDVHLGARNITVNGRSVQDICRIDFVPVGDAALQRRIVCLRTEESWIVNPHPSEMTGEMAGVRVQGTRHEHRTRRIVVNK